MAQFRHDLDASFEKPEPSLAASEIASSQTAPYHTPCASMLCGHTYIASDADVITEHCDWLLSQAMDENGLPFQITRTDGSVIEPAYVGEAIADAAKIMRTELTADPTQGICEEPSYTASVSADFRLATALMLTMPRAFDPRLDYLTLPDGTPESHHQAELNALKVAERITALLVGGNHTLDFAEVINACNAAIALIDDLEVFDPAMPLW